MADLFAYLTANEPPHKKLAGNDPAEIAMSDNALTLPATKCFVYGDEITLRTRVQEHRLLAATRRITSSGR